MDLIKKCGHCKKNLASSEFYRSSRSKIGLSSWCRKCDRKKVKEGRSAEDCRRYRQNDSSNRYRRKAELQALVDAAKNVPCSDCKVRYPSYVMDLDHTDPGSKSYSVASMVASGHSKEAVLAEISKCEAVCSNCHRERTYGTSSVRHPQHQSKRK